MPTIDLEQLQPLVDRLNELSQRAGANKGAADTNAADVQSLATSALQDVPLDGNGKVDAAKWNVLPPDEQQNHYQHLTRVSDAAAALLDDDGPSDPSSLMFRDDLSNSWVITLTLLAALGTIGDLIMIHTNYESATSRVAPIATGLQPGPLSGPTGASVIGAASGASAASGTVGPSGTSGPSGARGTSGGSGASGASAGGGPSGISVPSGTGGTGGAPANQPPPVAQPVQQAVAGPRQGPLEQDALLMVILMGALGGFLHLTSSLAKYVGNRQLLRSWAIYYLLMPVEGSALAVVVYLLLRVGVLNPSVVGADSTGNINWVGIYGFSVLAGIFSKQALEMLGTVFNTIFAKVEAKDSSSGAKPGGSAPGTTTAKPNATP